jgi:hypothetical protein
MAPLGGAMFFYEPLHTNKDQFLGGPPFALTENAYLGVSCEIRCNFSFDSTTIRLPLLNATMLTLKTSLSLKELNGNGTSEISDVIETGIM